MSDFRETLNQLKESVGTSTLLTQFSNQEILQALDEQRLINFLSLIRSDTLRDGLRKRQQFQAEEDQRPPTLRKNVLDFTIQQLVSECWRQRVISFLSFENRRHFFSLSNHQQLGMRLVANFPQEYYVGERSTHFNHAQQIERQYGIYRNNQQEENSQDESIESESSQIPIVSDDEFSDVQSKSQEEFKRNQIWEQQQYEQQPEIIKLIRTKYVKKKEKTSKKKRKDLEKKKQFSANLPRKKRRLEIDSN